VERRPLRLAVLGDSLAYGTGAERPENTLGARVVELLNGRGHTVELHVLAVPGATSADLGAQVRRAVPLDPDLALIVVGANDLARLVPPARSAAALRAAAEALRAAGTTVVVAPAPDLSSVPAVPPALRPALRATYMQLQLRQTAAAESAGAIVAPIAAELAAAFAGTPALFSTDRYHPSAAGYARIAAALAPHMVAAAERARLRSTAA
jgi:lysophospholipase L1-like esterase